MREIKTILLVLSVLAAFLIALLGCEGEEGQVGPAGPQGDPGPSVININGFVEYAGTDFGRTIISIVNSPSIPSVKLNDFEVPIGDNWFLRGARLAYGMEFPLDETAIYDLEVSYTKADGSPALAEASVTFPDPIQLIVPEDYDVDLDLGDGLAMTWSATSGDAYVVYMEVEMEYYDTAGEYHEFYTVMDTAITDTTFYIPGTMMFPDTSNIGVVNYYDGSIIVVGISGVWRGPEVNNITGDGLGMFIAIGMGPEIDTDLTLPGGVSSDNENDRNSFDDFLTRLFLGE